MTNTTGLNLLIPDKSDPERHLTADAFARGGGTVHRIGRFWDPPHFDAPTVRVYGPDSFCLVLKQKVGFELCSPDDDLLLQVPPAFLQRQLARRTLGEVGSIPFPQFIKPVQPKQFRGAVYPSADALATECRGLAPDTFILVSEPVAITAEVRSFVLDCCVLDAAIYEGEASLAEAVEFMAALTKAMHLPRAVVADLALIVDRGWAVLEFNAAWGSGLNGCDADKVLPAITAMA